MNTQLIEYLQSCRPLLEDSSKSEREDSIGLAYLYFAKTHERLSIHWAEKLLNHDHDSPFVMRTKKNQDDLLHFRPYFDEAFAKHKIASIASKEFLSGLWNLSDRGKTTFVKRLEKREKKRGILNALLSLTKWAFFPSSKFGSKNLQRISSYFLNNLLMKLEALFKNDNEMTEFLNWCGKRTIKISPWKLRKKELRTPPTSSLPIYKDEAAAYEKHFLEMACCSESTLQQDYAEMTIYLALCFAFARKYSNQVSPKEILTITKDSLRTMPRLFSSDSEDIRIKSRGEHDVIQLKLPKRFLTDNVLWSPTLTNPQEQPNDLDQYCKIVKIGSRAVPISQRLAQAVILMGEFSLIARDVENRIQEAFKVVGLSQSSGGISPRCFLNAYRYWEKVDIREHWNTKKKIIRPLLETSLMDEISSSCEDCSQSFESVFPHLVSQLYEERF